VQQPSLEAFGASGDPTRFRAHAAIRDETCDRLEPIGELLLSCRLKDIRTPNW
jgi:hypothetical protein